MTTTTPQPAPSLSDHISAGYRTRRCWNPISEHALDEVCSYLELDSAETLLDVGCGTGKLTCDWASRYGLVTLGIDISEAFVDVARNSVSQRGLQNQVQFEVLDGNALRNVSEGRVRRTYDRVISLGATGSLGGLAATIDLLADLTTPGGLFAIGDQLPIQISEQLGWLDSQGHRLAAVVRSTPADWDAYYSDQWRAVLSWVTNEPDHPQALDRLDAVRRHQLRYLAGDCPDLSWGILVFTPPAPPPRAIIPQRSGRSSR